MHYYRGGGMSLATKKVPKLRFSEFSDDWGRKKLGKIASKVNSRNKSSSADTVLTNSAVRGIIPQTEFFDKEIAVQGNLENYYRTIVNDFIYNPRISTSAPVGPFKRNKYGDGVMSPLYSIFRFHEREQLEYFEQYLASDHWHKYMREVANYGARSDRMAISIPDLEALPIPYPSIDEQMKIAGFLGVVDEKIDLLTRKKEQLETYKKGLMQKIFSQEIRFKDKNAQDFPEWQEKLLGELGRFKSGVGFTDKEQGGADGIPFFKVSDMNLTENNHEMHLANNYVSIDQITRNNYKPIVDKSIIFAKVGAAIFLERKRTAKNFLIDNNMMAFIPGKSLNFDFIRIIFDKLRLSKMAQVGALPSYNGSDLAIIKVKIPKSDDEQQKIADFLRSIDEKIDAEERKLEKAKEFKKALLQQMFV